MATLSSALTYASTVGFVALALASLADWRRRRDRPSARLAVAVGLLALSSAVGRVNAATGYRYRVLGDLGIPLFMASGLALLWFRDAVLPLPRPRMAVATVAGLAVTAATLAADLPSGPSPTYTPRQLGIVTVVIAVWSAFVGEPIVKFWTASRHMAAVPRARLRALSAGYAGIVFILVVAVAIVSAMQVSEDGPLPPGSLVGLAVQFFVVALIPVLYVALSPPMRLQHRWIRRQEVAHLLEAQATMHLGSWHWDLASGAITLSDEMHRIFGLDPQEPSRDYEAFLELLHPEDREAIEDLTARALRTFEPIEAEYRIVRPSGQVRWLWGRGAVVVDPVSHSAVAVYGTAVDVTDRKEAEAALRVAHEELSEFLRAVSHDLRTPLLSIQGYLKYLEQDVGDGLGADGRRYVARMRVAAERMGALIGDLLELSRIGRLEAEHAWQSLSDVAREVAAEVHPLAQEAEATIVVDNHLPDVHARPQRLRQLLSNLVVNAVHHGGRRPLRIEVGGERRDGGWVFWVRDDGVGVPPEFQSRIFRSFERVSSSATEGTGIGLAIVRKIVESHGGRVWLEPSEPGACFMFTFPEVREVAIRDHARSSAAG